MSWNFDCLTVIGGGNVIGVEIATIFAALGSPRNRFLEPRANRLLESVDPMISEADGSKSAF